MARAKLSESAEAPWDCPFCGDSEVGVSAELEGSPLLSGECLLITCHGNPFSILLDRGGTGSPEDVVGLHKC